MADTLKSWTIEATHTPTQRARLLAELALADFANDRFGMTDRVAFRIAEALEKYQAADARYREQNMPISNPAAVDEGDGK
jgi:hypothetical protein